MKKVRTVYTITYKDGDQVQFTDTFVVNVKTDEEAIEAVKNKLNYNPLTNENYKNRKVVLDEVEVKRYNGSIFSANDEYGLVRKYYGTR